MFASELSRERNVAIATAGLTSSHAEAPEGGSAAWIATVGVDEEGPGMLKLGSEGGAGRAGGAGRNIF